MGNQSVSELIQLLAEANTREATEFNDLVDQISELEASVAEYSKSSEVWEKAARKKAKENSKLIDQSAEIARASTGIRKKWDDAQIQLKEMKALNPKKQREQIKRLQESNRKLQAANATLKKDNKELAAGCKEYKSRSDMSSMTKVWKSAPHYLTLWPTPIAVQVKNRSVAPEQVCLLYIHDSGAGCMIHLNGDHEAEFAPLPDTVEPSEECKQSASVWLRRVNITQKGKVTDYDLEGVK